MKITVTVYCSRITNLGFCAIEKYEMKVVSEKYSVVSKCKRVLKCVSQMTNLKPSVETHQVILSNVQYSYNSIRVGQSPQCADVP